MNRRQHGQQRIVSSVSLFSVFEQAPTMHPLFSQASGITHDRIGAAIEVHKDKGPGLLESIYEWCLRMELELRGHFFAAAAKARRTVLVEFSASPWRLLQRNGHANPSSAPSRCQPNGTLPLESRNLGSVFIPVLFQAATLFGAQRFSLACMTIQSWEWLKNNFPVSMTEITWFVLVTTRRVTGLNEQEGTETTENC